jgi:hypothetical protein
MAQSLPCSSPNKEPKLTSELGSAGLLIGKDRDYSNLLAKEAVVISWVCDGDRLRIFGVPSASKKTVSSQAGLNMPMFHKFTKCLMP